MEHLWWLLLLRDNEKVEKISMILLQIFVNPTQFLRLSYKGLASKKEV